MEQKRKSISIGCGIWGPILSAVIIASRAVCGSVPMEEWSFLSWILMTLPMTFPLAIFAGFVVLGGIFLLIASLFVSFGKGRGF